MEICASDDKMGARFAPLAIEMILHFHTSAEPFGRLRYPACLEMLQWMLTEALVEPVDHGHGPTYGPTTRGEAWVWMLCNTPLPELEWMDRRKGASRPTLWLESDKAAKRRAAQKAKP